jgi:hypothetical protein
MRGSIEPKPWIRTPFRVSRNRRQGPIATGLRAAGVRPRKRLASQSPRGQSIGWGGVRRHWQAQYENDLRTEESAADEPRSNAVRSGSNIGTDLHFGGLPGSTSTGAARNGSYSTAAGRDGTAAVPTNEASTPDASDRRVTMRVTSRRRAASRARPSGARRDAQPCTSGCSGPRRPLVVTLSLAGPWACPT